VLSVPDSTGLIQESISNACSSIHRDNPSPSFVEVEIDKGDYGVQALQIPKRASVSLFSKGKVRLLYLGKRNRPLFVLGEGSQLVVRKKIEIYYNCNNVQEVTKLMFKFEKDSRAQIDNDVKVSLFSLKQE
jgi:hypothetical protein